ncbi:MAG: hypothetical protein GQF41_2270 [Candidatus Rifleibacterium amylolyticum]|nr:MAG: hypothetical protein GQF41_2270 [Candidatus Rifleibacterium amylolyticum]
MIVDILIHLERSFLFFDVEIILFKAADCHLFLPRPAPCLSTG